MSMSGELYINIFFTILSPLLLSRRVYFFHLEELLLRKCRIQCKSDKLSAVPNAVKKKDSAGLKSIRSYGTFCSLFWLAGLAGRALLLDGFSFNLDLGGAILFHINLFSRSAG